MGYYFLQYSLGLAILTLLFVILYVGWVSADARHPARKMYDASLNTAKNWHPPADGLPIDLKMQDGKGVKYPGLFGMSTLGVKRIALNRLFAEKRHLGRLRWIQILFFVL